MANYVFLYRVTGEDDRDSCAYLENKPMRFECGHYFGRMILHGSCYCNSDWKDYSDIETILTEDEYNTLRKIDEEFDKLGFGIKPEDERYKRGMELAEKVKQIFDKLNSEEAAEFFRQIIEDEKQIAMDEHDLTEDEVEEAFSNYPLDYQDRSIIGAVFEDSEELGREEAYSLGMVKEGEISERYFNFEKFGEDLTEEETYQELASGRCVMYMM